MIEHFFSVLYVCVAATMAKKSFFLYYIIFN